MRQVGDLLDPRSELRGAVGCQNGFEGHIARAGYAKCAPGFGPPTGREKAERAVERGVNAVAVGSERKVRVFVEFWCCL